MSKHDRLPLLVKVFFFDFFEKFRFRLLLGSWLRFFSLSHYLRGPGPKKRPIIFSQKKKSTDFYLPGRGNRILFKNELLLFQFRFKPRISSRKRFPSDSSKIRPKISPRKKALQKSDTIATQNNEKTTQLQILHTKLDGALSPGQTAHDSR